MLLVLGVVVMASVLGYAMLSSAAMQKQTSTNAAASAGAQGLAESGVNLAIYYLQNPEKAPGYPTTYPETENYDRGGMYWRGTAGQFVDFGSPSVGSVKVAVYRPDVTNRWKYEIESFGRAPGSALQRSVVATVHVNADYKIDHAVMFSQDAVLTNGTLIGDDGGGDVYSNGGVSIPGGGQLLGVLTSRKYLLTEVEPDRINLSPAAVGKIIPRFDEVRSYTTYEFPKGTTNQSTVLAVSDIGAAYATKRLDPASGNAAGVYYAPGDLNLHAGAVVNGTLIVAGKLTIVPALLLGGDVTLRAAQPGFPAVVVGGDLHFNAGLAVAPRATIEGLVYVGGRVDATGGLVPTLDVRGALLAAGTTPISLTLGLLDASIRVNYDKALAHVPDFTDVGRTPMSIKMKSWDAQ